MKQEIIRIAKEAEESYSFAVGDEMRRSLMAPWRIPMFPLSMIKRIVTHRKILKENHLGYLRKENSKTEKNEENEKNWKSGKKREKTEKTGKTRKTGKTENRRTGRGENWKTGKRENWKTGKRKSGKTGKRENGNLFKTLRLVTNSI